MSAIRKFDCIISNFRKELLILIEANLSHSLHYPGFKCVSWKMRFSEMSTYPQSLHYNFALSIWIKIEENLIYHCVALRLAFSHAKMDISWFLCKKLKIFDRKLICKIKWKYLTIPLIWYLICWNSNSRSEMAFIYIKRTSLVIINFS